MGSSASLPASPADAVHFLRRRTEAAPLSSEERKPPQRRIKQKALTGSTKRSSLKSLSDSSRASRKATAAVHGSGMTEGSEASARYDDTPSSTRRFDNVEGYAVAELDSSPTTKPADLNFHDALALASQQLRSRQSDGNPTITKAEMEHLVTLTREMEHLKQIMNRSQFTVEETWNVIERENKVEMFAQQLYDELLTNNYRLRIYFYGVDIDDQSKMLIRMLGTAVHFYERPQVMVDMLRKAGARHRGYGVTSDLFVEMQNAFFKVFPKFVGTDVFEASKDEWHKFWKLILDLLESGSTSPEGDRYAQLYHEKTIQTLQRDFRLVMERQKDMDLRHQFVGVMYAKAIEMNGDLSKFEALKDLRASSSVFSAYIEIIQHLHEKDRMREYLEELGARHVAYSVDAVNMRSFTEPFLFACRSFLQEEWNIAMESRFRWFFTYMVEAIIDGMEVPVVAASEQPPAERKSTFCMLFTDIEASSKLWQRDAKSMSIAVNRYQRLLRSLIAEQGAYEVKTVGDSFIIATKDVLSGVKIALAVQLELQRMAPIAPGFKMVESTEGRGDPKAWNDETLRVRIGLEYCTDATATYDTIHRRYDYYGPSVNRCARIEAAACGGQILMSREAFENLKSIPEFHDEPCSGVFRAVEIPSPSVRLDDRGLDHFVAVSDVGLVSLKGISEPIHLVSMVPICFAGRLFINKAFIVGSAAAQ